MILTLSLQTNILALLDFVMVKKDRDGDPWSDTKASKLCFGHGEFVNKSLRPWTGGKGGPTLEKTLQFEQFLRDQISDEEYAEFLKGCSATSAAKT